MTILVENTIKIKKGRVEEVLARFQKVKAVHTFDGFIIMEVLKQLDHPEHDILKICTRWEDHASFEKWLEHRNFEKAHQEKAEKPAEHPILGAELATYEVAITHHPAEK